MPTTARYLPWLCWSCGYVMDAATPVRGDVVPKDGDVAICINCGQPTMRDGGQWRQMQPADWHRFTPDERRQLLYVMVAQRLAKPKIGDLTKGDGRV